ncbi:MAG: hypothetical protein KDF49_14665, partial [Nitrosomonas sp.]|nr:hypothetical protein [Nitrosomonas sp.]
MSDYPKIYIGNVTIVETENIFNHSEIWIEIETPSGIKQVIFSGGPTETPSSISGSGGMIKVFRTEKTGSIPEDTIKAFDLTKIPISSIDAQAALNNFESYYSSLGTKTIIPNGTVVTTSSEYFLIGPNSNSITNSFLSTANLDFTSNLPHQEGNVNNSDINAWHFQGYRSLVDGTGDDNFTVFANRNNNYLFDNDGNDTITIENGAHLTIIDDNNADGYNTIILEGVNPADIKMAQIGNDLIIYKESSIFKVGLVTIQGHFKDDTPTSDTLKIVNDAITTTIDLTSLDSSDLTRIFFSNTNWFSNIFISYTNVPVLTPWDPLVIDLDGDGVEMIGTGQYFDLDSDGLGENVSWVHADDGLLALDTNGNGRIDSGSELFGNAAMDGFTMLAAYDSNEDRVIDSGDTVWSGLKIWNDANSDGQTQSDELHSLQDYNIQSIGLTTVVPLDPNTGGGQITHLGTVITTAGSLGIANVDLILDNANSRYSADYSFDLRAAFLPNLRGYNDIPDLHVALSLDNNENDPNSLMTIMQDIASHDFAGLFEYYADVESKILNALYRWAGVDSIDPASRGEFIIDARILEFTEKFLGEAFVDQNFGSSNPGEVQARNLEELWEREIFTRFKGLLLFQTGGEQLFQNGLDYDFTAGRIDGAITLSQEALDDLAATATTLSSTAQRQAFWVSVVDFINSVSVGSNVLSGVDITMLSNAITGSDSALVWAKEAHDPDHGITSIEYRFHNPVGERFVGDATDNTIIGTAHADTIEGLGGADSNLRGGDGDDVIYGHSEDGIGDDGSADTLSGDEGDDTLDGGSGNDVLWGGAGNDYLIGGAGDDVLLDGVGHSGENLLEGGVGDDDYRYSASTADHSQMYIVDESGFDEIIFGHTSLEQHYTIGDITFRRLLNDHLRIQVSKPNGASADIIIDQQLVDLSNNDGLGIERLKLYDVNDPNVFSWLDLKEYLRNTTDQIETIGTPQEDTIYGINIGNPDDYITALGGSDLVYGDEGNDEIWGQGGADELYGGVGNDVLFGGSENDTLYGGDGDDMLSAGSQDDILYGGSGSDSFYGSEGSDTLVGGKGDDFLSGENGDDVYIYDVYQDGNDTIQEAADDNNNDRLVLSDVLPESLIFSATGEYDVTIDIVTPDLAAGRIVINGQRQKISGVERRLVEFVEFDDGFSMPLHQFGFNGWRTDSQTDVNSDETVSGYNDVFTNGGTDRVTGGGGVGDFISTGAQDDYIYGRGGNDKLHGGTGDDYIEGGTGDDVIWGSDGLDTLSFINSASAVIVDILQGTALGEGSDSFTSIEKIYGSAYNDTIIGSALANSLAGSMGNDDLQGGLGSDEYIFNEGDGQDTITDSEGINDFIRLGSGIIQGDVTLTQIGNNLEIGFSGIATDKITIIDQFDTSTTNQIEKIIFDDLSELLLVILIMNEN